MWAKLMVSKNYGVTDMTNHTIIQDKLQISNLSLFGQTTCTICSQPVNIDDASAGPYNADGELTFICRSHRQNYRQLINLLADFITSERQKFTEQTITAERTAPDAWFLHREA
jgi:hypothetical protein